MSALYCALDVRRLALLGLLLATPACDGAAPCSTPPTSYEGTHTIARREAADPGHWDQCADTGDCLALCRETGAAVTLECSRVDAGSPEDGGRGDGGARDDATVTIHVVQQNGGCAGG